VFRVGSAYNANPKGIISYFLKNFNKIFRKENFMDYIAKMFERLDLQIIREFILNGGDNLAVSDKNYNERIAEAECPVFDMIEKKFPEEEIDNIVDPIHNYANITQNVYFEVGMQCGAILMEQLLQNKHSDK